MVTRIARRMADRADADPRAGFISLAQLMEACERWLAVTGRTGVRPPLILAPITGIFGDHLRAEAARAGLDVPEDAVITEPNRVGRTMVWPMRGYQGLSIRCFMPGSMT